MRERLEQIATESYGKLLAYLAARNRRDIQAVEDALADAMASALQSWPVHGEPDNPEAWLLRAARNRLIDKARRGQLEQRHQNQIAKDVVIEVASDPLDDHQRIPDERLELMFACAHPAIDPPVRTALLLQVVLGLSAEKIASAFLISPKTMSQRLVRAKTKIRDAGISFQIPEKLEERSQTVLDAVYASFVIGADGFESSTGHLTTEAIRLARIVVELLPTSAEALGLLALMLYSEARKDARRSTSGAYVPLAEQDTNLWNERLLREAEAVLFRASKFGQTGRYQLEAAIQSAHMQRRAGQTTPWGTIIQMYDALLRISPTMGVVIARAAALAGAGELATALQSLDQIDCDENFQYQPYWAVRAEIMRQLGMADCIAAYDRAIGLCHDPTVRNYLIGQKSTLLADRHHVGQPLRG